jgi:hypothetical protein
MKPLLEALRFFFLSFESLIVAAGIFAESQYSEVIRQNLASINLADDPFKFVVAIPGALCGWAFLSGRKLLFPEKDKSNVLQDWPDFWKLRAAFQAALTWSVIFSCISVIAWMSDWKQPTSTAWISLFVSIAGAATCFISVYNAQTSVEVAVAQFK